MATTTHTVPCSREVAFDILADPRSLGYLVAGTRKIRRFDPRWPEPGSAAHYSAGVGPFVLRDRTTVVSAERPRSLVLDAQVRPFGHFSIRFEFADAPDGVQVKVIEEPRAGFISLPVVSAAVGVAIALRNVELMRRLHKLAERRSRQRAAVPAGSGQVPAAGRR